MLMSSLKPLKKGEKSSCLKETELEIPHKYRDDNATPQLGGWDT